MSDPDLTAETQAIVRTARALTAEKPNACCCQRFILAVAYIDAAKACGLNETQMLHEIAAYAEAVESSGGIAEARLS